MTGATQRPQLSGSRTRLRAGFRPQQLIALVIATILVGVFTIPPVFALLASSFRGPDGSTTTANYAQVFSDPQTPLLIGNTVLFSLGSAVIALVLGTLFAFLVERTDAPFKNLVYLAAFLSIAIPGVIKVMGWILFLGPEAGIFTSAIRAVFGPETEVPDVYSLGA